MRNLVRPTMPLPDLGQGGAPSAGLQVTAQAPNFIGAPRPADSGQEIASALSNLNPALQKYLTNKQDADNSAQFEAGQSARAQQADRAPVAMTPEQDPAWQAGYMQMHGKMLGIQDAAQFDLNYQQQKTQLLADPSQFNAFVAQQKQSTMQGMTDPDALKGYMPEMLQTESKLRNDFALSNLQQTRENRNTSIAASVGDDWNQAHDQTPETAVAARDASMDMAFGLGTPRREAMGMYIRTALADPTNSPADLQTLYTPGKDGVIPAYTTDANGQNYDARIKEAINAAQARTSGELAKQQTAQNVDSALTEQKLILDGKASTLGDPMAYVKANSYVGGMYAEPQAARAAYTRIATAQANEADNANTDKLIAGLSPMPFAQAALPQVKARIENAYNNSWANVNPSDPASFQRAMEYSNQLHQAYNIPDPYIKQMSEGVANMGTTKDATGKETVPAQFNTAYALWKGLAQSNNPQLSTFNTKSQAFLQTYDSGVQAGMPTLDAFKRAHMVGTQDAEDRGKLMFGPGEESAAFKSISGRLNSLWHGESFFNKVNNADDVAGDVLREAKDVYKLGGVSTSDAVTTAQNTVLSNMAFDGLHQMVRLPADFGKQRGEDDMANLTSQAKAVYESKYPGQTFGDAPYHVTSSNDLNGQLMFAVRSGLGDVILSKSADDLDQAVLKSRSQDTASLAARANVKPMSAEDSALMGLGITPQSNDKIPGVTPQDPNAMSPADSALMGLGITPQSNQPDTPLDQLKRGDINGVQYRAAMAAQQTAQQDKVSAAAAGITTNVGPAIPAPNTSNPTLKDAVPGPTGLEMTPKMIAQKYAGTNPAFALGAYGEGFRNVAYKDSKGDSTIGLGYNMSVHSPDQVRSDLRAAGVTDDARLDRVVAGKEGISPDEAARLYARVQPQYTKIAQDAVGSDVWNQLPANRQAVLTDLAYQSGNLNQFHTALAQLKSGESDAAINSFAVKVRDSKTQQLRLDSRRNELRRGLWQSTAAFQQLVTQGV